MLIKQNNKAQRGAALITVLLVIAIVSVIAVNLGGKLQLQITRMGNLKQAEQSYWMWLSAEDVLKEVLQRELDKSDGVAHRQQNWASRSGPFPVEGGLIAARVNDLYSCFNLNSLVANANDPGTLEKRKRQYKAMLQALGIDNYQAEILTDSLVDWLDENSQLSGSNGAEDPDYESLPKPYLAANSQLLEMSELRMVRGYSTEIVNTLESIACVIPNETGLKVNINTLEQEQAAVLTGITEGKLTLADAAAMINDRPPKGYESDEALAELAELEQIRSELNSELAELTVNSEYFQLVAMIQWGEVEMSARSVLHLNNGQVQTLYRAMGD